MMWHVAIRAVLGEGDAALQRLADRARAGTLAPPHIAAFKEWSAFAYTQSDDAIISAKTFTINCSG